MPKTTNIVSLELKNDILLLIKTFILNHSK